ncbi:MULTISPECIES: nuclear transport factor 2 family protein [unclassified Streptomyces]|uniref:nuclear transport factor 2 family protein n=1 Tax=unclassified Streptomyces TaxID=2593676 RepID=UPI0013BE9387|nr:nuclear transport factor 2 family protein [Streptomyces sp. CB09001]
MTSDSIAPVATPFETPFDTPDTAVDIALYHDIQQFYVRQMHAGDGGDFTAWAASFTEDAVFVSNGLPAPVAGRAAIDAATRAGAAARAERGATHRHVVTMLDVRPKGEHRAEARSYVLVVEAIRGGATTVHVSTVCEDRLVLREGRWLVEERRVTRDDRPKRTSA